MKKKLLLGLLIAFCTLTIVNATACSNDGHTTHTYDKQVISETYKASDATCTERTTYYYSCECGAKGTETFESGDASHKFENGTCDVCGELYNKGLLFTLSDDKTYYSVKNGECTDTEIIIPSIYNDLPVKAIDNAAFSRRTYLTSITIPDSVTNIGEYAFNGCGGLTSIIIPDSVKSIGEYAFYYCDGLKYNVKDDLKYLGNSSNPYLYLVGAEEGITSANIDENCKFIGSEAFRGYVSLTSVTIPDGVTSICSSAFWHCDYLESVTIPDSVTHLGTFVFAYCYNLKSVTIGNGLTTISNSAFRGCVGSTSFTIPDSVTSIDDYAFNDCDGLTSINIPDSVTSIGSYVFNNCDNFQYNVKDNLKYLGNSSNPYLYLAGTTSKDITSASIDNNCKFIASKAFEDCDGLTSVTIPAKVKSIGEEAFYMCDNLSNIEVIADNTAFKSIDGNLYDKEGKLLVQYAMGKTATSFTVPNGVETIGASAFYDCNNLTSITIPDSVTSIDYDAFSDCDNLTNVKIGDGLKIINGDVFFWCDKLANIEVSANNTVYKSIDGNLYSKDGKTLIKYAIGKTEESFTVPDGVEVIGEEAFYNCENLTSVTISDSVVTIDDDAFENCENLISVTIGDGVKTIDSDAFKDCGDLTTITIGKSVTDIYGEAFEDCNDLTTVYYKGTESEWYEIYISSNDNDDLLDATCYYYVENAEDVPNDGGNYWYYDEDGKITIY